MDRPLTHAGESISSVLRDPELVERLNGAGFFYGNLAADVGTTSKPLRALGLTDREMRSGAYRRRIHPEDLPTYLALWQRVDEGWDDELFVEYRLRDNSGRWHWIQTHAVVLDRTAEGSIGRVAGSDRVVTARREAERYLSERYQELERRFRIADGFRQAAAAASAAPALTDGLALVVARLREAVAFHRCDVYAVAGDGCAQLLTVPDGEELVDGSPLLGEVERSVYPVIADDVDDVPAFASRMSIPLRIDDELVGIAVVRHTTRGFYHGSDLYPVLAFAEVLAASIRHHAALRRAEAELATDELTGFLTRRSLAREAPAQWADATSASAESSVAMIDLDRFKLVNDRFGHRAGDRVLRAVAAAVRTTLRHGDLLYRYGGEELLVILRGTDRCHAGPTMERVRAACEAVRVDLDGVPAASEGATLDDASAIGASEGATSHDAVVIGATVSIGVATAVGRCHLDDVIEAADAALYRAKAAGRNRVETTVVGDAESS